MKNLTLCLQGILDKEIAENIAVRVGKGKDILVDMYMPRDKGLNDLTIFDMASVTKIVVTTSLALIALDKKLFSLSDKVSKYFNCPEDKVNLIIETLPTLPKGRKNLLART